MLATKDFDYEGLRQQREHFERLLASWQKEIGDRSEDVPRILREYAATNVRNESRVFNQGPADATASAKSDPEPNKDDAREEASILITDFGVQNLSPIELWNKAPEKYCALERCEQLYEQAAAKGNSDGKETAEQQRAIALAEAVHALRSLGNQEARRRLADFERSRAGDVVLLQYGHQPTFLSHFEPTFWTSVFPELFPYGDCQEK